MRCEENAVGCWDVNRLKVFSMALWVLKCFEWLIAVFLLVFAEIKTMVAEISRDIKSIVAECF